MTATAVDAGAQPQRPARPGRVSSPLAVRLASGLLWVLVAAGAFSGALALLARPQADGAGMAAAPSPAASSVGAEGFAELYVAAFLQAGRDQEAALAPYYAGQADLDRATPMYALRTATVSAEALSERYWAVTVAADVAVVAEGVYRPAGVRYYSVGVADTPGGLVATGLPSQVPAPATGQPPRLALARLATPARDPRTDAAQRFLSALLAGQGELDRYVAPGAGLAPVHPAPFAQVALQRVGAALRPGGRALLAVEAAGTDSAGRVQILGYWLELAQRAGRWEVAALHPAPPLADLQDEGEPL